MILIQELNGVVKATDRHGTGHVEPALDARQNIENFKGAVTGGLLQASFNRQLDTGDKDDLPVDDPAQNNCQYFIFPVSGGLQNEQGKLQIHETTPKVKLICNAKLCKKPPGSDLPPPAAGAATTAEPEEEGGEG